MRKTLTFTCIFFLFYSYVNGQIDKTRNFGFKFGYNKSIVNGVETDGSKTGLIGNELYLGFFSDLKIAKRLNFQAEFLYSYSDDFNYFELPINFKFQLHDKFSLFAGPKIDFIADEKENEYNRFNKWGYSAEIGFQYDLSNRFFLETRYSVGFTKQITDFQLDINEGKRNTFRIGVGYRF